MGHHQRKNVKQRIHFYKGSCSVGRHLCSMSHFYHRCCFHYQVLVSSYCCRGWKHVIFLTLTLTFAFNSSQGLHFKAKSIPLYHAFQLLKHQLTSYLSQSTFPENSQGGASERSFQRLRALHQRYDHKVQKKVHGFHSPQQGQTHNRVIRFFDQR
jgi:hypothetical protein